MAPVYITRIFHAEAEITPQKQQQQQNMNESDISALIKELGKLSISNDIVPAMAAEQSESCNALTKSQYAKKVNVIMCLTCDTVFGSKQELQAHIKKRKNKKKSHQVDRNEVKQQFYEWKEKYEQAVTRGLREKDPEKYSLIVQNFKTHLLRATRLVLVY